MLENPASDPSIKRYTPPGRNRLLNRRKSSDRFDRINNSQSNEGEKGSSTFRNMSAADHGDSVSSNYQSEGSNSGFIVVDGCSSSEAVQLMVERWAVAMDSYNDPSIGITEKPVIYSGYSGSAWGSVKLPHQLNSVVQFKWQMAKLPILGPGFHLQGEVDVCRDEFVMIRKLLKGGPAGLKSDTYLSFDQSFMNLLK